MKCLAVLLLCLTTTTSASNEDLQEFVRANNLFATSAYKEIKKNENGNFLVSPYSAEAVLAFVQTGCKGDTAKELRNTLYLPDDNDKIESAVKASIFALTGNKSYTLHTANKVYVKEGFSIRDGFKKTALEVFGADVESIDFVKKVEAAKTMNKWVEGQTNNKIQNLIDSEKLTKNTRVVLINALYFNAGWLDAFYEGATSKKNFYKTTQDVVEVDTMHNVEWFHYYDSSELNAQFLELPFVGGDLSMVIVLPKEKEGLATLEKHLDKVLAIQPLKHEYVSVAVPKFKIESTIEFTNILKNLGVRKAFDNTYADLSGVAGEPGDLVISDVVQKTYIDVSEKGVEAAAATYVLVAVPDSVVEIYPEPIPKPFIADHPFIFYVKVKDLIIFAGRVLTPKQ